MTTMLSLILAFMLSIGGSPVASVNPAGCPGDTGIQAPIDNNPTINRFFDDYREKTASRPISKKILKIPLIRQPKTQIRLRFSLSLKEELRLMGYMDSMNLYQAFNQNPVNFTDPMGTVVSSELVNQFNSVTTAENRVRTIYASFRQLGYSHASAYKQLIDSGYVTHQGFHDDLIFELSLATSPMYGSPKARITPKKRPTAETIGDFAAGFGDEVSATLFEAIEAYSFRPPTTLEPQPRVVPTKIYREFLQQSLGLGEIEDMVDYDSPAYEMGEYMWHGTVITTGVLQSTYNSNTLLNKIDEYLSIPKSGVEIKVPYRRPTNATTKQQRLNVQGKPCHECGEITDPMYADHKTPLVVEYYETGKINQLKMKNVKSVRPHCPKCSAKQGGKLSNYAKRRKKELGL
jgi:hypothetical protein